MAAKRRVTLESGHTSVYLSHFPFTGDHGPDRHREWRLREGWDAVIHGHTHSAEKISQSDHTGALQVHIGVDAWDFQPAPWDTVCDLIRAHHT